MGSNFPLINKIQQLKYLVEMRSELMETMFELMIFCFDTILNHNKYYILLSPHFSTVVIKIIIGSKMQ
jgi:hypothetical protein